MKKHYFFIILSICLLLMGCSTKLNETDQQIINTVMNNDSEWNHSDTFNMNFIFYDDKPAIRVWNGGTGTDVCYYVKYTYFTIDYKNNRIDLVETKEKGVSMPDNLRFGNNYPKNASEEERRKYLEVKYKAWKHN